MKWIGIIPLILILTACGFRGREVIEYQQVVVTPVCDTVSYARPIYTAPVDVTITNIDYY